jgi:hypothetical protein
LDWFIWTPMFPARAGGGCEWRHSTAAQAGAARDVPQVELVAPIGARHGLSSRRSRTYHATSSTSAGRPSTVRPGDARHP